MFIYTEISFLFGIAKETQICTGGISKAHKIIWDTELINKTDGRVMGGRLFQGNNSWKQLSSALDYGILANLILV